MDLSTQRKPRFHWVFRAFAFLAILSIVGFAALLGLLWLEHRTEITLPAPTGPFAVGREIYDWQDEAGSDISAPAPGTKRELLVWIWYPAQSGQSGAQADDYAPAFLPAAGRHASQAPAIFKLLTRDLSKVHGHSLRNAKFSSRQSS